ncbi:MAG TPA: ABC transporter permease [Cyclobacteriaceae bacterium]
MKEFKKTSPPKWAERFLSWYCKPALLEDLQGDLHEYFERNVKAKGFFRAKLIYIADVFKFLRFYTIRKPEFINLLINWIMLSSYIKTSGRSIVRHKLFSTINIIGLAISMSVGLMMISVLNDAFSYDKFHKNHSRIYRLISRYEYLGKKDNEYMATTSLKAAKVIQESLSVPEEVAIFKRGFDGDMQVDDKIIHLNGYWANPSVLKTFSFEFLKGNADTMLKEPFSIVITEKSAKKLFGNDEALGRVITLNDKQYTITGLLKDIPVFSHIKFDMLGSLSTNEIISKDETEMAWNKIWDTWAYILLPANADLKDLQASLDQLSKKEDSATTHIELALQPLDDIMTGQSLGNPIGPIMGRHMFWIFIGLTFIVILSACFNYTNLSIARSLKRTREVGIRKVIGAMKSHVLGQFVVEAIIISLCSLVLAFFLFIFLKPFFLTIEPEIQKIFVLNLSPSVILYFVLFAIFIGIAAGVFPALFFSRVNPLQVMKDFVVKSGFKKMTVRKVLIVFQYSISIIFITSTVIIYKQYKHFVSYDLGFQTENILNISLQGNNITTLKNELNQLSEVKEISQSLIVTSVGNYWGTNMKYHANPLDSIGVYYNTVDENYIPLHKHKLLAGRNFIAKADSSKETEVIVNEQVLKRFNIAEQNPAKAINDYVTVNGKDLQIIGVIKNFHYGKVNDNVSQKEIILRYSSTEVRLLNVKIQSDDLLSTYAKIEAIWKKHDPVHPFEAKFYDDQIDEAFAGMRASVKMAGFLAFLTICIASLGLLGMVVFTTETRLKEISIRKALGASEAGLMYLLGRGFFILLSIATAIAIPVTYLFFDRVLFQTIANHAPISIVDLSLGVLAIMAIAFLMIGSQTLKVARTNPSEVLKSE